MFRPAAPVPPRAPARRSILYTGLTTVTDSTLATRPGGSTAALASLTRLLTERRDEVRREWRAAQPAGNRALSPAEADRQASEFLGLLAGALAAGADSPTALAMDPVRAFLGDFSRTRAQQGFSPTETATFVFSLKAPLFRLLREDAPSADVLAERVWAVTEIVDGLGLYTTEAYQRGREELIQRQQADMLELSTPVVSLWDGVLALPMIGTLDSARTQVVMETLLQRIVETGAEIAIVDITGVPTVDTLTAQHLIKTVTAARLMGAECIISGIRPQIAQTIVHLGVDLGGVTTKASLADAFRVALARTGRAVVRSASAPATGDAGTTLPAGAGNRFGSRG
jgi:rsbT co-antagonist protein RsbR